MRPRGPLVPVLISSARGRRIGVGRDQRTGGYWVYDLDSGWVAGTFDVGAVLPASEQRDEYLVAGRLDPDYAPTRSAQIVLVDAPGGIQRCRIHDGVWVSVPRPYADGVVIRLTWTDLAGRALYRYTLPPLDRSRMYSRSSGYLLPMA